jgi:hypothetical protein
MKVICSWCEAESRPAVVREKEPLEYPEENHVIYPGHKPMVGALDRYGVWARRATSSTSSHLRFYSAGG